jgi:hypothetical protein
MGVTKESGIAWKFASGSLAGLIASSLANPLDLIKIRMQSHKGDAMPISYFAREIHAQGGIAGFWKGVGPTCIRAMKMNGTKLAVYDSIKQNVIGRGYKEGVQVQFMASVGAGFFQTVVTCPIDNIKTRIMTAGQSGPGKYYT